MGISKWFSNLGGKKEVDHHSCMKFLGESLEPFLDEEISIEDEKAFREHIEKCMPCFERFNLDKTIKEVLKSKCKKKEVPDGLVDSIRVQISQTSS